MFCARCGASLTPDQAFCPKCGQKVGSVVPGHVAQAPSGTVLVQAVAIPLKEHSPFLALLSGIFIPGAGQAYNGQPVKGFFLFFLSVLVLPYLYSLYDAVAEARRISREGGRFGRGGLTWVFLQAWLFFNTALLAVIGLSIAGVLR